ncbi:hypothetical protein NDU88_001587 [Pleurodeles waltl]|uniref:Uncharacterized protein n=1 Tax=Pleurodeles waltl TaxID=8319 RepID=A0AAV7KQN7_PLEWA|nr:hypothetical protein NDU88_001587 [Pleurodeles waltl]
MSSGREPIRMDFRLTADRKHTLRAITREEEREAEKKAVTAGEKAEKTATAVETAEENSTTREEEEAVKDPRTDGERGRQRDHQRQPQRQWRTGRQYTRTPAKLWEERSLSSIGNKLLFFAYQQELAKPEEGQEQSVRAFFWHKREDPGMDGGDGEEGREKETRSVTGGDRDFVTTEEQPEDLHNESEVREAHSASPGHA